MPYSFDRLYEFSYSFIVFSNIRLRHQKTCSNGRQLLNKPLHKHQVLPLLWDTMGFFGMTQVILLKGLSINVCIHYSLHLTYLFQVYQLILVYMPILVLVLLFWVSVSASFRNFEKGN